MNILNSKGKIILGTLILSIALVCVFVGGNNQQTEASETGSVSINLSFSELLQFAKVIMGIDLPNDSGLNVGGTRWANGISADSTSPVAGEVRGTTLTITSAITAAIANFSGLVTHDAGVTNSYTNSTSTADTTQLLVEADILNYSSVIMTPTTGATTLTFNSSSTMENLVPVAGDWFDQTWHNASTTAAITLTFAAGTGIDLEISTSSANSLIINPDGFSTLRYFRKPATASAFDIGILITHFDEGD